MKVATLANANFRIELDAATGALLHLSHPADPHAMSWVMDPREAGQISRSHCWGLGYAGMGRGIFWGRSVWDTPRSFELEANRCRIEYEVSGLRVVVERELEEDQLAERYTFALTEERLHTMGGDSDGAFGIYTPWNDSYPDSATCVRARCNAHLWMGGADSWVCGIRMGGEPPHLGLVLEEGELDGYSIADRDTCRASNHRGVIIVHPSRCVMEPGMSRTIGWKLFWHEGRKSFAAKLSAARFPRLEAEPLVALGEEPIRLSARLPESVQSVRLTAGEVEIPLQGEGSSRSAEFHPPTLGNHEIRLEVDGRTSRVEVFRSPRVEEVLASRTAFIAQRQQVLEPGPYYGAFAPYDNETEQIVYSPGLANHSCGGEQMGMGVLLALVKLRKLQEAPDLASALERHYQFVHGQLQCPDGTVLYYPGQARDSHLRLYNFPWVAQYHLEMARLGLGVEGIRRSVAVMRSYYRHGGAGFLAFSIPMVRLVRACRANGLAAEAEEMLAAFLGHADRLLQMGTNYPSHEVAYEQSIVAPACEILLQAYQLCGNSKYLEGAAPHLACLEAFNGGQPSHRLNEIAIRHWDGYWFGKRKLWGDTFPHYWSTLTALVFARLAVIRGEKAYAARAWSCLRGNLSLFNPEGRASCAHIYPRTINGQPAACDDPLASDQDWALIHWLWTEELLAQPADSQPAAAGFC